MAGHKRINISETPFFFGQRNRQKLSFIRSKAVFGFFSSGSYFSLTYLLSYSADIISKKEAMAEMCYIR